MKQNSQSVRRIVSRGLAGVIVACSGLAMAVNLANAANTGSIQGSVQDATGKPLAGAVVDILLDVSVLAQTAPATAPFHVSVLSLADGTYQATGLPAGPLRVCALGGKGAQIGYCPNMASPTMIDLAAGESVALAPLVMKPGYALTIRVNDPQGVLAANEGKTAGAFLLTGIAAGGAGYMPLSIASTDSGGRNLQMLVPFDVAMTFAAQSRYFTMVDELGVTADPAGGIQKPFTVPSGGTGPTFSITITGINASGSKP